MPQTPAYRIGEELMQSTAAEFPAAVAGAHGAAARARCMCCGDGVEMYVARLAGGFILKRMPNTGSQHACDCPSYEPPATLTGLGRMLGTAIQEDPNSGETRLRLAFALHKSPGRSAAPSMDDKCGRAVSQPQRLSLTGLLHYLWDQAELTRWHPGFMSKRSWATVRRHLLTAAEGKVTGGGALGERLFIPEIFSAEQKEAIRVRRLQRWTSMNPVHGARRPLVLLVGELKELLPARFGFRMVIKHMPDQPLSLDASLMGRITRLYGPLLTLWNTADGLHLVTMLTLDLNETGVPIVMELCLMATTSCWIPLEDAQEMELVCRLVAEHRSFIKGLRYNLPAHEPLASAVLTDTAAAPELLYIVRTPGLEDERPVTRTESWTWLSADSAMPALPAPRDNGG